MKTSAAAAAVTTSETPQKGDRRRTQKERSAATRGSLLRAAVEVISEFGWMGATTRLVAARAGVTRGALQHYFESREDLLKAVAAEIFVQLHARLDTGALSTKPLERRVELLIQHYYDVYTSALFRAVLNASFDPNTGVNKLMHDGIVQHQEMIDRTWRAVFLDLDLSDAELRPLRRLVMSTIRGYAVQSTWHKGDVWRADSMFLRDLITARLLKVRAASP